MVQRTLERRFREQTVGDSLIFWPSAAEGVSGLNRYAARRSERQFPKNFGV